MFFSTTYSRWHSCLGWLLVRIIIVDYPYLLKRYGAWLGRNKNSNQSHGRPTDMVKESLARVVNMTFISDMFFLLYSFYVVYLFLFFLFFFWGGGDELISCLASEHGNTCFKILDNSLSFVSLKSLPCLA